MYIHLLSTATHNSMHETSLPVAVYDTVYMCDVLSPIRNAACGTITEHTHSMSGHGIPIRSLLYVSRS